MLRVYGRESPEEVRSVLCASLESQSLPGLGDVTPVEIPNAAVARSLDIKGKVQMCHKTKIF